MWTEDENQKFHEGLVKYGEKIYHLEPSKALQSMSSSWYDFSITKNIFSMFLVFLILILIFSKISKTYTQREKQAPKGLQSLIEPLILFMRDDVVKPAIGDQWKKFFSLYYVFVLFYSFLQFIRSNTILPWLR